VIDLEEITGRDNRDPYQALAIYEVKGERGVDQQSLVSGKRRVMGEKSLLVTSGLFFLFSKNKNMFRLYGQRGQKAKYTITP